MQRREFISATAGIATAGAIAGCAARAAGGVLAPARGRAEPSKAAIDATAFHAARRFVATPFGRIAYVERGDGAAALFLHGFPLNGFQWRGALERLSAVRRCIAPDFMGLGYTEVGAGQSLAPAAQADMLVALLDALGVHEADLVANDSGSAVAQLLVVHHPERVRTLLLTNGDTERDCPPPALLPVIALAREGRFVGEWLAPWLADTTRARSAEGLGGLTYSLRSHPIDEAIACYLAPLVQHADRTHEFALALERNSLSGIEPALRRSRVPTRIVWGTADTTFSQDNPGYLDGILGRPLGVRRVEGASLFFPEEFPDLIAEEARHTWSAG